MVLMLMVLVAMMTNLDIHELQLGILSRFHCSRSSKLCVLELILLKSHLEMIS